MKTLKFAAFAMALGFFAASCGNAETETTTTDSTIIETPVETVPEQAPVVDTTVAPVTDSAATTTAPATN
jgi:hypothetical protein